MKLKISIVIISIMALSCNSNNNPTTGSNADMFAGDMDTTVKPGDDFFMYAMGKWVKNTPIPEDESSWGIGNIVNDENQQRLHDIVEDAAKEGGAEGTTSQKIGDFWIAAMDSATIEQQGTKYLQPYLDEINSVTDIPSLMNIIADLKNIGVSNLFSGDVGQDDKNSEEMSYRLSQGGIGLPERDYYFKTDSSTSNIRKAYINHIAKILEFQGKDSIAALQSANNIMAMETKLAKASRTIADLRDPYSNYHKTAIPDLKKLSSSIHWELYLKNTGVAHIDSVIVGQPEFFKSLDGILKSTPINVWKDYFTYNLVNSFSGALPEKYGWASFNFNKLFSGATERKVRWKRVIRTEEGVMGELMGQLYVEKYFDSTSKLRYEKMAEEIRSAYKNRIEKLTWMSDSTKQKAIAKLEAIKKKIGYPDKWKDFSAMKISKESYVLNLINAGKWWHDFEMNKLGKPVDRDEWEMFPQTYNAYYNPGNNEIVFPAAAFIVPGYADKDLDDAVMYGYVGASYIGHEITHGFDDQGRLYDAEGNLHNWWTKNDSAEFAKRAAVIIKQFDSYEPLPGVHINGSATQGENIADLGGLEIGIDAFKLSDAYKKNEVKWGMTPMQRFFMGYALSWQYKIRPESLKSQLMTDVHSPAKYRVNGPFSDIDQFYETYHVVPDDKMYLPDSLRVRIW